MKKTFLDSGVLLTAWRGADDESGRAISLMQDAEREFYTSLIIRLEVIPRATFHRQAEELKFYNAYFSRTKAEEPLSAELGRDASELACKHGLSAADALNIAAALRQGVQEFITSELPAKPMFRVPGIKITSLHTVRVH